MSYESFQMGRGIRYMPAVAALRADVVGMVVVMLLVAVSGGVVSVSATSDEESASLSKAADKIGKLGDVERCNACRAVVDKIIYQTRVEQSVMHDLGHMDDDGNFVVSREAGQLRAKPVWDSFCSRERFSMATGKKQNSGLANMCKVLFGYHKERILDVVAFKVRPGIDSSYVDGADFICGQNMSKMCMLDKGRAAEDKCSSCYSAAEDIAKEIYAQLPRNTKTKDFKYTDVKNILGDVCSDLVKRGSHYEQALVGEACVEITDGEISDEELTTIFQKPVLLAHDMFTLGKNVCVSGTEMCSSNEELAKVHAAHTTGDGAPAHKQFDEL